MAMASVTSTGTRRSEGVARTRRALSDLKQTNEEIIEQLLSVKAIGDDNKQVCLVFHKS